MIGALNRFRTPAIKIHGLLRSGTNYLQAVMTRNFRVVCLDSTAGGWKHGHCHREPKRKYVFVVKNPYAWLGSFYNWEKIHNRTSAQNLAEFIDQPVSHEQLRLEWNAEFPLDVWNKALASWISDANDVPSRFIRYEDLIDDFEAEMGLIRDRFQLVTRRRAFENIEGRVDTWPTPNPRGEFQIDYYRSDRYLQDFDAATLAAIRKQLDVRLLSRFSYVAH